MSHKKLHVVFDAHFNEEIASYLNSQNLESIQLRSDEFDKIFEYPHSEFWFWVNPLFLPLSEITTVDMKSFNLNQQSAIFVLVHRRPLADSKIWLDSDCQFKRAVLATHKSISPMGLYKIGRKQLKQSLDQTLDSLLESDQTKIIPIPVKAIAEEKKKLRPALFLDRDGVIIKDKYYQCDYQQAELKPEIVELIKFARQKDHLVICLTNQSGIAREKFSLEQYQLFEKQMLQDLESKGAALDGIFMCPYSPSGVNQEYSSESLDRKPLPGMLIEACEQYDIDPLYSIMVGDKTSDQLLSPIMATHLIQGEYPAEAKFSNTKVHQEISELVHFCKNDIQRTFDLFHEGIIKFNCKLIPSKLPNDQLARDLIQLRQELFERDHIGVTSEGIGFGNVSIRREARTLISGSQTGHIADFTLAHLSEITDYHCVENWLECTGETKASSESLTHCMIYDADPEITCVIHIHDESLWKKYLDKLPTSYSSYGSIEQANEVNQLLNSKPQEPIIIMAGHFEGILVFGKNIETAKSKLNQLVAGEIKLG